MKRFLLLLVLLSSFEVITASAQTTTSQQERIFKLKEELNTYGQRPKSPKSDSSILMSAYLLWNAYLRYWPDSTNFYLEKYYTLAQRLNSKAHQARYFNIRGVESNNPSEQLDHYLKAEQICGECEFLTSITRNLANYYLSVKDYPSAEIYFIRAIIYSENALPKGNEPIECQSPQGDFARRLISTYETLTKFYLDREAPQQAEKYGQKALSLLKKLKCTIPSSTSNIFAYLAESAAQHGDLTKALDWINQSIEAREKIKVPEGSVLSPTTIYLQKARYLAQSGAIQEALAICQQTNFANLEVSNFVKVDIYKILYEIYKKAGKTTEALQYNDQYLALRKVLDKEDTDRMGKNNTLLRQKEVERAKAVALQIQIAQQKKADSILQINKIKLLQTSANNMNLAEQNLKRSLENEQLQNLTAQQKIENSKISLESEKQKAEINSLKLSELRQQIKLKNRTRNFLFGLSCLIFFLLLTMIWANQKLRIRNKSIQRLSAQNLAQEQEKQQILSTQNETLEHLVTKRTAELKASQAQLIQSEKLASLGELTAGIAHEIQNPLNFVNNFAEVSAEMLDEMHEELEKGDTTEAIAIATDLKTNLEKINHHGQRASSIVKGMLEHSRLGRDAINRVSTDLNALTDEYLRLAYHGWRAKDSSFNCKIETNFDPDLPKVPVIPQDIGRVLLNLINNAFYAVQQRATTAETLHATSLQTPYQPTVTVSTQKTGDQILIKVQDNGNGIPEAIREKIFQPFFTTKPTGQGTGLGLSLAYDIVTKGHGGNLEVQSATGSFTAFTIKLPIA